MHKLQRHISENLIVLTYEGNEKANIFKIDPIYSHVFSGGYD